MLRFAASDRTCRVLSGSSGHGAHNHPHIVLQRDFRIRLAAGVSFAARHVGGGRVNPKTKTLLRPGISQEGGSRQASNPVSRQVGLDRNTSSFYSGLAYIITIGEHVVPEPLGGRKLAALPRPFSGCT